MKKLQMKLRSRSGASITFALLLFLVCAVIGSVVLTAGMTAAGRMSRLAEMDQRYYSVTSAAELMRDSIDGKTVTVAVTAGSESAPTIEVDGVPSLPSGSFLADASYKVSQDESISAQSLTLTVYKNISDEQEDLAVKIVETLSGDTLTLDVSNKDPKDVYTLRLTFTADAAATTDIRGGTSTTTTRVTWSLADVRTVTSEAAP